MANLNQDAIHNAEAHAEDISKLMAALEADYDQLEALTDYAQSLRDELEELSTDLDDDQLEQRDELQEQLSATEAELNELQAEAGEYTDRDGVERAIDEYPLSVEVRSDWTPIVDTPELSEYAITLATGGPAARIRGELDVYGNPATAWMEACDWGTPWTEVHTDYSDALLEFAQNHIYS